MGHVAPPNDIPGLASCWLNMCCRRPKINCSNNDFNESSKHVCVVRLTQEKHKIFMHVVIFGFAVHEGAVQNWRGSQENPGLPLQLR